MNPSESRRTHNSKRHKHISKYNTYKHHNKMLSAVLKGFTEEGKTPEANKGQAGDDV